MLTRGLAICQWVRQFLAQDGGPLGNPARVDTAPCGGYTGRPGHMNDGLCPWEQATSIGDNQWSVLAVRDSRGRNPQYREQE
jgi:hypothetical protein